MFCLYFLYLLIPHIRFGLFNINFDIILGINFNHNIFLSRFTNILLDFYTKNYQIILNLGLILKSNIITEIYKRTSF